MDQATVTMPIKEYEDKQEFIETLYKLNQELQKENSEFAKSFQELVHESAITKAELGNENQELKCKIKKLQGSHSSGGIVTEPHWVTIGWDESKQASFLCLINSGRRAGKRTMAESVKMADLINKAKDTGVTYAEISKALETLTLQGSYTLPEEHHGEFWGMYTAATPNPIKGLQIALHQIQFNHFNLWNFLDSIFPGVTSDKYKIDLDSAPNIKIVRKEEPKGKLGVL
jgi:hypothetical protein